MAINYKTINLGLAIGFLLTLVSMKTLGDAHHVLFFLEHDLMKFIVFGVTMLSFFLFSYNNPLNFKKSDFALVLLLMLTMILVLVSPAHGFSDFLRLIIFLPFIFIKPIDDDRLFSFLRNTLGFFPIILFLYSLYNGIFWENTARLIYNSTDPNFSAMYALMGMMLADKLSMKKTFYAFMLLGLLTLSRNFILALMFFYFVRITERYGLLTFFYENIRPIYIFILAQIVVLSVGAFLIYNVNFNNNNALLDGSNRLRFECSTQGVEYLLNDREAIFEGAGHSYWSKEEKGTGAAGTTLAVHNSFLHLMIEDGIVYGVFTLLLIFVVVNRNRDGGYEYIYAFLMPTLFLGDIFTWSYLFMWCFVLSVRKQKQPRLIDN